MERISGEREPRTPKPVVRVAIINPEGKLLLLQKSYASRAPGLWELPGGGFEKGEDTLTSAIRETNEETGLSFEPEDLLLGEQFDYTFSDKGREFSRRVLLYQINLLKTPPIVIDQTRTAAGRSVDKHINYKWVTPQEFNEMKQNNELSGNTAPYEPMSDWR